MSTHEIMSVAVRHVQHVLEKHGARVAEDLAQKRLFLRRPLAAKLVDKGKVHTELCPYIVGEEAGHKDRALGPGAHRSWDKTDHESWES